MCIRNYGSHKALVANFSTFNVLFYSRSSIIFRYDLIAHSPSPAYGSTRKRLRIIMTFLVLLVWPPFQMWGRVFVTTLNIFGNYLELWRHSCRDILKLIFSTVYVNFMIGSRDLPWRHSGRSRPETIKGQRVLIQKGWLVLFTSPKV